jgi:hypothetical protein
VGAYNPDRPTVGSALLPRYAERQPGFFTWDVRVGKEFAFGERHRLRATFEVFNLTNRLNLFSEPISGGSSNNANLFNRDVTTGTILVPNATFKTLDRLQEGQINAQIGIKYTF